MRLADVKTTEWLLINWGRWAYHNRGLSLNYPSIEPYELLRATSPPSPSISDEDAVCVDLIVSQMRFYRADQHEAIILHYLTGQSFRHIARQRKSHHRVISDLVTGGKLWVEGALQGGAPSAPGVL